MAGGRRRLLYHRLFSRRAPDFVSEPDEVRTAIRSVGVEVRLERVEGEPWWLLTDRPVETAEQAAEAFRMYGQRWAIEDAFKVAKTCLGWEDVQVLA